MRELHVQLTLGATFPGEPIEVRTRLIEAIENEIGEVGDTGTGGGVMDIWLTAAKPQSAARRIRSIAKRLGISEWTEVTVRSRSVRFEILCDDAYPVERAKATSEVLVREIEADASRWAEVSGIGVECGIVEIDIDVRDPSAAIGRLEAIAERLGISDRTRIDAR
jgi:hypothetical protein